MTKPIRKYMSFGNDPFTKVKYYVNEFYETEPYHVTKVKDEIKRKDGTIYIGELNEDNKLHGRGVQINSTGTIHIGYWDKGCGCIWQLHHHN